MDKLDLPKIVLDWSAVFMRLTMHDFTRYTRATGLSLAQMNVLLHLYYRGPSEVMTLTDLMQVSPAGASQMVERMVQQGLVRRVESPEDRRVREVHLTDQGRAAVEASIAARRQWMESLMALLTDEQEEAIAQALLVLTEKAVQLESGHPVVSPVPSS
jgi:DNA-binding MarR family transcriptional regulator